MAAARGGAAGADALTSAAYLAVVRLVLLPLLALSEMCLVIIMGNSVPTLIFLDQRLVQSRHPSFHIDVEFIFSSIVLDSDVFVVEFGERYSIITVKFLQVGREGPNLSLPRHCANGKRGGIVDEKNSVCVL